MLGEEFRVFLHARGAADVVPHPPDEEQADEKPQQQQGEVAEALCGGEEQKFAHVAQD